MEIFEKKSDYELSTDIRNSSTDASVDRINRNGINKKWQVITGQEYPNLWCCQYEKKLIKLRWLKIDIQKAPITVNEWNIGI